MDISPGSISEQIESAGSPRDSRRTFLAAIILVSVVVAGVTWMVASHAKSPRQIAAEARPPTPSAILAPVEHRILRKVVPLRGNVTAPAAMKVPVEPAEANGAAVITAAPVRAGEAVDNGTVVAEIALRPVILLVGRIPMFRDLRLGDEGRDVLQLQQALVRRGLDSEINGVLGPATANGVAELYAANGYSAPHAGETLTDPERREGDPPPIALRSEIAFVGALPARLVNPSPRVGRTASGAIASLSAGRAFVRADATSADRDELRTGAPVSLHISGRPFRGSLTAIGPLRRLPGSDLRAHPLTIRPAREIPRSMVGRDAQVIVTSRRTRRKELVVPVAALSAAADGSAHVTLVRGEETRIVTVTAGLSANGFVAVQTSDGNLRRGDRVVVGR